MKRMINHDEKKTDLNIFKNGEIIYNISPLEIVKFENLTIESGEIS
jgi:hypothetical protein